MTHKTKATGGGRQWENTKHKPEHHSDLLAGGQCVQCGGLLVDCQPGGRFLFAFKRRGYFSTKGSRANLSGTLRFSVRVNALFISLRVFSRWRMIIDNALFCSSWLFIIITFKTMRRSTSHHGADSDYSDSLALRRWRYSTSRFNAAVTNCPVLSPGIFTASTLFITSCGTLAATVCDFAFTAFVAMLCTPYKKQMQYAGKKISVQHLACLTPRLKLVFNTLLMKGAETTKPRTVGAVTGLLTTNDRKRIEVAMLNHTTHPQGRDPHNLNKYIWRFIALSTAQPRVITIGATSEQEARQQSPTGWVMVLASRFHHRCLFFVCLSSGYGVVPFQRMRGRSLMKRSSGKLSDGAGGRTRRSRLRWRTTLASVISPDSFIFIKSYLRAHLLWRFLFLMKTYSGSGVSYLKIWFNFSCLALMTARNNICRCFVFTSRTVGDNMDLFMVLTCNALRRDASYHGGGYRFVRIRPLMKSSSGKCSGRGNSGGTGLLLMRSRSLAARAAFSFCRSTSNGTPLSFMVPPVYPLLTDGYRCIFRTNYLINTSDHIIREPEYTGAIIPHLLAYAQLTADMALNEAKAILIADCEYGVMRDDRFNALKQEFDGTPEDTDIALLCVADMVKAACFLLETAEHSGTGSDILNIASDYAEYVAEARYRRKFQEVVSHE